MDKRLLILLSAVLVGIVLLAIFLRGERHDDSAIFISGNMEITEVAVSFKIPGRMDKRLVDEGQPIIQGNPVAYLEDKDLRLEVALRRAELATAEAALQEAVNGYLPEEIAQAKAKAEQVAAEYTKQELDFVRQKDLFQRNVISQRELDISKAAYEVAQARLTEADEYLALLVRGTRIEKIEQAKSRVEQARESLDIAQTRLSYATLTSPLTGLVLSKGAEPGEYVSAGTPVVTVGNLQDIWLRAYISETDLGRVKWGQEVTVTTDTYPDKTYKGRISFISSEAEFTPKNVQTEKERVKLVYRIKVVVPNPDLELKPGMPADGLIALENS